MDAVRARVAGLSAGDDAERGEARELRLRQAGAQLAEVRHGSLGRTLAAEFHLDPDPTAAPALDAFAAAMETVAWNKDAINAAIKDVLKQLGLKMPQLAMPVRVLTMGTAHTPSVDAVLELLGREKILARLKSR